MQQILVFYDRISEGGIRILGTLSRAGDINFNGRDVMTLRYDLVTGEPFL